MADIALAADPAEVTHLIVTREPDKGMSAESPQLRGLCFGRPTETEFRRDYRAVLKDIGVGGTVRAHVQTRGVTTTGREFLLRCAEGPDMAERLEVLRRVELILRTDHIDQAADMLNTETTATGEVVFVAALPADTLGFFMAQMYDEADVLVICASVAEQAVFTMTLASGKGDAEGWSRLDASGWDRNTTISQVLTDDASGRRVQRLLV